MKSDLPTFLLAGPRAHEMASTRTALRASFLEKALHHLSAHIRMTYEQWETIGREGLFQRLDARVKVLFLLFFVIVVSLKKSLLPEIIIGLFVFILVAISRLELMAFYKRVFFFGFIFGFLIVLPSALNIITEGELIIPLIHLGTPHTFWIYSIPATIGITREGIAGVAMLSSRVINSLTLSLLVIHTTPFAELMRALKSLRVPDPFLIVITLSYKYIFLFARTVEDIHLSMKGRLIGLNHAQARQWTAGRMAFIFRRTQARCEEVFRAMQGRGFAGDIVLYRYERLRKRDFFYGVLFLFTGVCLLWL